MGKRGRKTKAIHIEIGQPVGETRYKSREEALRSALPFLAEAIAGTMNHERANDSQLMETELHNPHMDREQHNKIA